jgi:hypothetical protein
MQKKKKYLQSLPLKDFKVPEMKGWRNKYKTEQCEDAESFNIDSRTFLNKQLHCTKLCIN